MYTCVLQPSWAPDTLYIAVVGVQFTRHIGRGQRSSGAQVAEQEAC